MEDNINIFYELKELGSSILLHAERQNPYACPEGYFDDLSQNITKQIWIQSLPSSNTYQVPADYFEHLPEIIIDKLAIKLKINNVSDKALYYVPDNYFNNLADNILKKIKEENNTVQQELEELSPLLSKIPKSNVFSVPSGYFENLVVPQPQIINKQQPAKVFSIGSRARKWIGYAAAACVAAVMAVGGYFYMKNNPSQNLNSTAANNYSALQKQAAEINVAKAISNLPDSALNNYLINDMSDVYTNQNSDKEDMNIKTLLENTSDAEIENYLLENAEPGERHKGI